MRKPKIITKAHNYKLIGRKTKIQRSEQSLKIAQENLNKMRRVLK